MRIKYKKIIVMIFAFQEVLLLYFLLHLRPTKLATDVPLKDLHFKLHLFDAKSSNIVKVSKDHHERITQWHTHVNVTEGECIGLELPVHLVVQHGSWSAVADTKDAFVFSAYRIKSGGGTTVIGASTRLLKKVYCQYWNVSFENHKIHMQVKQARIRFLPEHHGNRFSGALFECPSVSFPINYVSLVTEKCCMPSSILMIKNASIPQNYKRKFTVCLKPLHFRYGRAYELVEWIELHRIMGAEKFIIYNYSLADNVADVLKYYVKQEVVEVVQWNLPIKSYTWPKTKEPVEIHSIGMLPMLQDCLFRNKHHSELVVNMDVDEFIVPRSSNVTTWPEMMTRLSVYADTYLFRNTFFRKEWNTVKMEFPDNGLAEKFKLVTLQKLEREDKIFPSGSRSKYFTRTSKTNTLMIHEVAGGNSYTVPVDVGLLHHYRNWLKYNDSTKRVEDDTLLRKYGTKLVDRVQSTWKELVNVELDIPI